MHDPIMLQTLAIDFSNFLRGFLLVLFLAVSVGMILVVLIQRPQGGGLSGAFGASADGAGQTALGVKTGDALTTATIVIFVIFLLVAIWLNFEVRPEPAVTQPQMSSAPDAPADPPATTPAAGETPTDTTDAPPADAPDAEPIDDAATGGSATDDAETDEPQPEPEPDDN